LRYLNQAIELFHQKQYNKSKEILLELIRKNPVNSKANEILAYIEANNVNKYNAFNLLKVAFEDSNFSA
jgi:predicted Zn-dependent protease